MDYKILRGALLNMAADKPGSLACHGCGCEHNCQQEGCAILREAIATMEQLYKDCEGLCDCCTYESVLCGQPPCDECFDARRDCQNVNWAWRGVLQKEGVRK